jgi:uncharacterized protein (DUF362 family)
MEALFSSFETRALGVTLSRRAFFGAVTVPLLASACTRRPYNKGDFTRPERSEVALLAAASYDADLADVITRGLSELRVNVQGRRVFLKPNLIEYEPDTVINTNPVVVAAAAIAFRRAGAASVTVGEGPGHRRDTEYLLTRSGLYDHLHEERIRFVDLNLDDVARVPLRSQYMRLPELALPVELLQSDFIVSMPKLKTHHWVGMTASMKNLFGVVPGAVYGWPKNILHVRGIHQSILDLVATIRPHLSIVDAITSMEGDGPIMGRPKQTGFLAMGRDLVAVDATCARLIGLDPSQIGYINEAGQFLGWIEQDRIDHRGELPARFATTFDVLEPFKSIRLRS